MNDHICYTRGNSNLDEKSRMGCLSGGCNKLNVFDWLKDLPDDSNLSTDVVEIRFKNSRKLFFINVNKLSLKQGDLVAVEASPGHDIGTVSLTGALVLKQLNKHKLRPDNADFKKIYRLAKQTDIEKWKDAVSQEDKIMPRAKKIVSNLKLKMKISDIEFQGDGTKAIFYYIADERVDFRELIKIYAEEFRVRIEMRQIGARQEAGRIGGIGPCGKELCCTKWITNFVSVSTSAARQQELSLNPQKLAGQCGKLKCCLNYELSGYIDESKDFPKTNIPLETIDGTAYHQKTDVYKRLMWYSFDKHSMVNLTEMSVDRVKEVIELNKKGTKVDKLVNEVIIENKIGFHNIDANQESITRFDNINKPKKKKKFNKKKKKKKPVVILKKDQKK